MGSRGRPSVVNLEAALPVEVRLLDEEELIVCLLWVWIEWIYGECVVCWFNCFSQALMQDEQKAQGQSRPKKQGKNAGKEVQGKAQQFNWEKGN